MIYKRSDNSSMQGYETYVYSYKNFWQLCGKSVAALWQVCGKSVAIEDRCKAESDSNEIEVFACILHGKIRHSNSLGSCTDIEEQLKRHNAGAISSTKTNSPSVVVGSEQFDTRSETIKQKYDI
jgi:predicted GIY-YIG superfamily endonuclease